MIAFETMLAICEADGGFAGVKFAIADNGIVFIPLLLAESGFVEADFSGTVGGVGVAGVDEVGNGFFESISEADLCFRSLEERKS
jgi:hypothetical protein